MDPFLQYVIFQVTAIDLEYLQRVPNMYHSLTFSAKSLRLLRERLEDALLVTSNETICAVV